MPSLSHKYQDISRKAVSLAADHQWPDSTEASRLFPTNSEGAYVLPTFPPGEGALAVTSFLGRNSNGNGNKNEVLQSILAESSQVFDQFVGDLHSVMHMANPTLVLSQKDELDKNVWRVPPGTHHITLAVFQEHPSMFWRQEDKQRCSHVTDEEVGQIRQKLTDYIKDIHAPVLQLDSLLVTGTGTVIAGFIDSTPDNNGNENENDKHHPSFQSMREDSFRLAASVIGVKRLTSRPKNLIHATVGRVLALPTTLSIPQRQRIAQLVQDYNTQILPQLVQKLHQNGSPSQEHASLFPLQDFTMLREIVWTCQKVQEYQTWHLS